MAQRTLFTLQADSSGFFDGSFNAKALAASANVKIGKGGATTQFSDGAHIEIPRSEEYDKLQTFTVSATVKIKNTGQRQNIIEGQNPPIALFIEKDGKLMGSVNTAAGWQSVTSGRVRMPENKSVAVSFSRDRAGKLSLQMDGKEVGNKKVAENLAPFGDLGMMVGVGMDKRNFALNGELSGLSIQGDAIDAELMAKRAQAATKLRADLKLKLNLDRIRVNPDRDESYARLQPIKSILAAVGVNKLSDLSTLSVPNGTVITAGKIMVAPEKSTRPTVSVNWGEIAKNLKSASAGDKRNLLANYLPNRNSVKTLKAAGSTSGGSSGGLTPTIPGTRLPNLNSNINAGVIGRARVVSDVMAGNPTLRGAITSNQAMAGNPALATAARQPGGDTPFTAQPARTNAVLAASRLASNTNLATVIDLDANQLKIKDSNFIGKLDSAKPQSWPMLRESMVLLTSSYVLPVDTSVMIAGVLDLRGIQLRIEPDVKKLYIIAEQVMVDEHSTITWRRPGGSTPPRADNPDLNGRSYSGQQLKPNSYDGLDGGDGADGGSGTAGAAGRSAPALELWARSMNGMPNLDLNGENGVQGGRGQRGGRGGNGADGRVGKRVWFFGWHCTKDPGDGGDGGNGGDGGRGGRGGSGADGGDITVGVLDGTLESTVTANIFRVKNQGGQQGRGGPGGPGGLGGFGGSSGRGDTCKDAEDGHPGAQGQPGRTGDDGASAGGDGYLDFFEFDEDAWEELLTRPWLTELSPDYVFPNDMLTITGSGFTPADRVHIGSSVLAPTINADETISVRIPSGIGGGEQVVFVRRPDGTESNRLRLWVKPQLNPFSAVIAPGATVSVTGRAFLDGASALIDGESVPANVSSPTALSFQVPGTGGAGSSEHSVQLQIRNPDGMLSNIRSATIPHILEIPFRFPDHALNFDNFKDGAPNWGTYEDTYGAAEIYHELLDPIFGHPVLTAAFYAFYHYFLKGEDNGGLATGFCTSMSTRVLDELWTGSTDTFTRVNLNAATRRELTAVHGRLLSRESLIHFHDQSRQGVARVLQTYREIEQVFRNGCDRHNAPMLFFIPSGAIWDDGYVDSLGDSHCIVPIRFVYPPGHPGPAIDGSTDPDGVTLYCWDCNHPPTDDTAAKESENCRLVFKRVDGTIHYDYLDGGGAVKFSSEDGVTLGQMSNGDYLLSDHDLPFSGPYGVTRFVLDFLLSPADLQIADENGLRTGHYGTQILSEIPDSHPCFLMKGAYLLPPDTALERDIVGNGTGTYSYHSVAPAGTSISLEGVSTHPGEVDRISMNADGSQIRLTPGAGKAFSLQLARDVANEVRTVSIAGIGGGPAEDVDITVSPDLSIVRVGNRSAARTVDVTAFSVNKTTKVHASSNRGGVNLPQDHDLLLTVSDWADLDLDVETVHF